jgi:polyisoprenoid-binding protein YceI
MNVLRGRLRSWIFLPCLILLLAVSAQAQHKPLQFNLNPGASTVNWTLNTNVHTVHGTFKLKSGTIEIDPATGNASGLIVVDATSGESGDSTRDSRMNKMVLESEKFPIITFRPAHVEGKVDVNAPGSITVSGVMNLHGQDHPLQITVALQPSNNAVTATTSFILPFVAWGLKDPSWMMFRTEKQVSIEVHAVAIPTPETAHALSSPARAILRPGETGIGR